MALKDRFDKIISYFDTDEVDELENPTATQQAQAEAQPKASPQPRPSQPRQSAQAHPTTSNRQNRAAASTSEEPVRVAQARRVSAQDQASAQAKTTIALKFPKKYEDAEEIVDLLIRNECVLIDFQYMLDAQARRCLDFIDGASKVLYGNLEKVGSSMYLLTPANVIVDIEEMALATGGQDVSYNYDMKRR